MMTYRRYHPLTILFSIAGFLKNFGIIIVIMMLNIQSDSWLNRISRWLMLAALAATVISSILKWFTHRYAADTDAFRLEEGLFEKTERTVDYSRIQNIHRHRSLLHKLFGVTSVTFETGTSGMNASVKFDVLAPTEADKLEAAVHAVHHPVAVESGASDEEGSGPAAPADRTVHFTPTRKDTVKAAFTSFSFLVLIAAAASILSKLDSIFSVDDYLKGRFSGLLTNGWVVAAAVILLVLLSVIAGLVWTFLKYGSYEIASDNERIFIRKGTVDETAFTIAKGRVQGVEITQSFMKRMLGLAEVKLISAGDLGDEEHEVSTLYPFLPVERAHTMIHELLPQFKVLGGMHRLPIKSLAVRLMKPYWVWLIVTAALVYFRPSIFGLTLGWLLVAFVLLLLTAAGRAAGYWNTQYAMDGVYIQLSEGVFEKTTFLTRREKIIEASVKRTKLQQMTGLATIRFINRAHPVRHADLPDVPLQEALAFLRWYYGRQEDVQNR
ncbi:PH domain-containing protein [Sporosarcina trichiuri]|uniref:PH domain-containing protein n=1 Tax=Sporosarcina trichiuri TaxID=3056445 RepID=UPI0025B4E15A|nr:PH domain-containing protein [Sporosarcina sp. 0.2-SM1T-5]WJY26298.1 PH domain-containing protein [Sporosarcina sp. 0.2-SM1T-5]